LTVVATEVYVAILTRTATTYRAKDRCFTQSKVP
jgi:hypothetical protein